METGRLPGIAGEHAMACHVMLRRGRCSRFSRWSSFLQTEKTLNTGGTRI